MEIDFAADSPDQLYAILKDLPNQDDSEEVLWGKRKIIHKVSEVLRPFTLNSSNKTKLELLKLALDYHLEVGEKPSLFGDFYKFAVYVQQDYRVDYKDTEIFFDKKIIDLPKPFNNNFLEVGVKCLEQHLGLGNLSQLHENGEFEELKKFCDNVTAIEGIRKDGIQERLEEFLEKLSEEE